MAAHAHHHDEWCRPLPEVRLLPKHASLAQSQVLIDRHKLDSKPPLLARKWKRMSASPFAFLRGAAPLFDECLRREGSWAAGPTGGGSLVGDLHLENFGVFFAAGGQPIFHVNDFDLLRDGPWRFDVLRLLTSILLARPELRVTGTQVQQLAREALEGHQQALAGKRVAPPAFVLRLCRAARVVPNEKLLDKHVEAGRLIRDEKHPAAPAALVKQVPHALERWAATLPEAEHPPASALEVLDVRRRISGTGSLGVERLMVLTRGDASAGPWLLDLKEVDFSAERIVEALRGAVKKPPGLLGYAMLGKHEVIIRRLAAGEEKLTLEELEPDQAPAVIRFLGALAGEVHHRLARSRAARWSPKQLEGLLASARRIAAMHEETFLEFCAVTRA